MIAEPFVSPTIQIPYITARLGEDIDPKPALISSLRRGLSYEDEHADDRDAWGALWARGFQLPAAVRDAHPPRWRDVEIYRQRETMSLLRCQVCAEPASRTPLGVLFLATRPPGAVGPAWPEGMHTAQPPLCLEHAVTSAEQCRYLVERGHVALRAQRPVLYGVLATRYQMDYPRPKHLDPTPMPVPYSHPQLRWCLAQQQLRQLRGVSVVDLAEEATAAGLA
jgi:hypothetical protein